MSKSLNAGDFDLTSPVAVDAKLASSFTTSGDVGAVSVVLKGFTCDANSVAVTTTIAGDKVSYTNSTLSFGANCSLSVKLTGSTVGADGGYSTAEATYTFTTALAPKVYHYNNFLLTVFGDGTLGRILPDATAVGGYVCIQPPPTRASRSPGQGGAACAPTRQPEGTSAGSRLGGGVLSIQAMTAPCR